MSIKIKEFWEKHDQKILTIMAIVLVSAISFRAGETHQKSQKMAEIKVNLSQNVASNPHDERVKTLGEALERNTETNDPALLLANNNQQEKNVETDKNCVLVGSKNSNKYHQPNCRSAARIKPENRVCFSSKEDAAAKGYQAAKDCNK